MFLYRKSLSNLKNNGFARTLETKFKKLNNDTGTSGFQVLNIKLHRLADIN